MGKEKTEYPELTLDNKKATTNKEKTVFTCCFVIILCTNTIHFFVILCCVQTHRMSLFFFIALQSLYVLSTFCAWTGQLKWTLCTKMKLYEAWIFLRLDLTQLKLECLNCQKFNIRTNNPCCSVYLGQGFVSWRLTNKTHWNGFY